MERNQLGQYLGQDWSQYEEKIRYMVEKQGLQHWKVAEELGISRRQVSSLCKKFGIKTHRVGPRSGSGHTNWKGGRILVGGYWYIYCPDHPNKTKQHRIAEHRLVMESKLKRYLEPKEVVHHIDGDKQNNDPSNLIVFGSNAQHLSEELKGRTPNWSPEGRQRTLEGLQRFRKNQKASKSCDDLHTQ